MENRIFHKDGFISERQFNEINYFEKNKPMSVHWELRTILYLGIVLFSSGLGVFIYKNINSIGHIFIISFIGILCAASFYYAFKERLPFSYQSVKHPSPFYDYVVLLFCLLFATFISYLQYQYAVFGEHYGLVLFLPASLYFFCAYFFDHKGVLSMAITALAAWLGVNVAPLSLLKNNDLSSPSILFTSILLALVLLIWTRYSRHLKLKKHFDTVYNYFASNLLFISSLAGIFEENYTLLFYLVLIATAYYYVKYTIQQQSFLFLLITVIYSYIALSYIVIELLDLLDGSDTIVFGFVYFTFSSIGIVYLLMNYKKILKRL